jgi:hypothetical protein
VHACATTTPARLLQLAVMGADALSCGCDGGVSVPRLLTREVAAALARSSRARHGLAAAVALARAPSHVAACMSARGATAVARPARLLA